MGIEGKPGGDPQFFCAILSMHTRRRMPNYQDIGPQRIDVSDKNTKSNVVYLVRVANP
jgi:hypothetical protein